jgi:hypothetical protein
MMATGNPYSDGWKKFKEYAAMKGYTEKVVGDDAFTKKRNPQSSIMRLISVKKGKLTIYEDGKGRYEI